MNMGGVGQHDFMDTGTKNGNGSRPSSKDGAKKNLWSSMLDGVASGKRLPAKNLLVLGRFLSGFLCQGRADLSHDRWYTG